MTELGELQTMLLLLLISCWTLPLSAFIFWGSLKEVAAYRGWNKPQSRIAWAFLSFGALLVIASLLMAGYAAMVVLR